MLNYFSKASREAREKKECEEAYSRGFEHTTAELKAGKTTVSEVYIQSDGTFNTAERHNWFDKGARAAADAFDLARSGNGKA